MGRLSVLNIIYSDCHQCIHQGDVEPEPLHIKNIIFQPLDMQSSAFIGLNLLLMLSPLIKGFPSADKPSNLTLARAADIGCPSLQDAALTAMKLLMTDYWYNRDCRLNGVCGHFPEPGTSSPGLSGQEWTNVNTFETMYNTMWQTGNSEYNDLIEIQAIIANQDHGSNNIIIPDKSFTSQDDAAWAGLTYVKVQQYNDAHGIHPGSTYYYDRAHDIQKGIRGTWLSSTGCKGGVPQNKGGTGPNTITSELFFTLTVWLAAYRDTDGSLHRDAQMTADWFTTVGQGLTLRDSDGLWFDSQNSTCNGPGRIKWTYNQGLILSAFGGMASLVGNPSYIDWAVTTLNAVVSSPSTPPLPQAANGANFPEVVNGNLAEWCDGASESTCNHDQQYFKGAFMKHVQYFLDNANDTIRNRYTSFVGEQASAVIHYGTGSNSKIGSVWYAPNTGGSTFNYKTQTAGLDALNCAQKYATCP